MFIEQCEHSTKIYPFAADDADPRSLAAAGYLEVSSRPYEELKGKVRFNISIEWLTAERWGQLQEAVAHALTLSRK